MKYAFAILSAIAVVTLAHDASMLDEATDLLQEKVTVDDVATAQAKVASHSEIVTSAKTGSKAGLKARTTVMIGTHELDADSVSMAKHALSKITMKLGARHPIFLGEAAGIADFASQDAKYVSGGYDRLKSILRKVDEFETELKTEKQTAANAREKAYYTCDKVHGDEFGAASDVHNQNMQNSVNSIQKDWQDINDLQSTINTELIAETELADELKESITDVDDKYKLYWSTTEERHEVRNVLMQALWLVCTGFASFRHTSYCTNIRQQPDFDEDPTVKGDVESMTASTDAKAALDTMRAHSANFGDTMQPVWEQQKEADKMTINQADGDVDMEKGFVNNRAPWGVDPEGMEARATAGTPASAPASKEEELGESNKDGDMSNEEMSSKLTFLVESSSVPERISVPITAFIQALNEDDTAVQQGLVEALVDMDTAEGKSQSDEDYTWYNEMIQNRNTMFETLNTEENTKFDELRKFEQIEAIHSKMDLERSTQYDAEVRFAAQGKTNSEKKIGCDKEIIELEALLEVCNEELTNILRLNSLLRYLVVGDEAVCDANQFNCKTGEGSCTWRTRGTGTNAEDDTSCETETGQDIPCDYAGSLHTEARGFGNDDKFCACEYGFYGSFESQGKDCNLKSCPGFGRIRYSGQANLPALTHELTQLKADIWGMTGGLHGPTGNIASSDYQPIAACSGVRSVQHGTCDSQEGKCDSCYLTAALPTPPWTRAEGVIMVPEAVIAPMPYSGSKLKCEMWTVPLAKQSAGSTEYRYGLDGDPNICSGRGKTNKNFMGYVTGICDCEVQFYGTACERVKCQDLSSDSSGQKKGTGDVYFTAESPNACNGKGTCQADHSDPAIAGTCTCDNMATGESCEEKRCPGFNIEDTGNGAADPECGTGVGTCNTDTGRCLCATGASCGLNGQTECPNACIYNDCQANCQSASTDGGQNGLCDRFSGLCICNNQDTLNGPSCEKVQRGAESVNQVQNVVWTESMDKWGWSTCNDGYLLVGMKSDLRGSSDALYNLDVGICAKPYEAGQDISKAVENYRCYHENWWKKFDTRGGKFCRRNYFVAGLFRSHCNSLYCIEMAKCCSVKRSLWTNCAWENANGWNNNANGHTVTSPKFIVGFYRSHEHTLGGITSFRACTPIWYGQLFKYKTRFDN